MNFSFDRTTYEEQFQELKEAGKWLARIGIEIETTRFSEVLQLNKELSDNFRLNLLDELIEKHGNLKLWFALTEASIFIKIYKSFKNQKSHVHPRAKLKKMLEGPYYSWDEDVQSGNIDARNTLFELEAASCFKDAGAKIKGFDDVDFVFKKVKFNVQCKRIHSGKKVQDNISGAATQFYKKMKKKNDLKGIICLSIDKLIGTEEKILKVKTPNDIQPKLTEISNSFIIKHRSIWHNLVNTNILAVVLFHHIIASIKEEPYALLTGCNDVAVDVIPRPSFMQAVDYNLIVELGKRMQGSFRPA